MARILLIGDECDRNGGVCVALLRDQVLVGHKVITAGHRDQKLERVLASGNHFDAAVITHSANWNGRFIPQYPGFDTLWELRRSVPYVFMDNFPPADIHESFRWDYVLMNGDPAMDLASIKSVLNRYGGAII